MSDTRAENDRTLAERRRDERVSVNAPATFTMEHRLCACTVLNMSASGLLLRFDQKPGLPIAQDDVGKNCSVVIGVDDQSGKSILGTIVRVLLNDNVCVAAISAAG
jgi:hypothetical protein